MPEPQNMHSSATSPTSIVRCWTRPGAPKAPLAVTAAAAVSNVRRAMALLILSSLRVCVLGSQAEIAGASLFVLTARRYVGRSSLKVSAGSGGQPARLDAWSIAAAKGHDGCERIRRKKANMPGLRGAESCHQ